MAHRLPHFGLRAFATLLACLLVTGSACTSRGGDATEPPGAGNGTPSGTPSPQQTQGTADTPTPTAERPPHRIDFASGEVVDVSPAVVFIDTSTGASSAWVFPTALGGFGVGPTGDYIVWSDGERVRLFRTDEQADRVIDAAALPTAYAAGDAGFIALRTGADGAVLAAFDARGKVRADLGPTIAQDQSTADWGPRAIAIASRGAQVRVSIHESPGAPGISVVDEETPPGGGVWVRWSHAGERLAVVTARNVRVFDLAGRLLGEATGEYSGNPRWSPDDQYLYTNAMPALGGDLAYLFTADASPVFRYVSTGWGSTGPGDAYGYGCSGDVWLDARHFGFQDRVISVEGEVEPVPAGADPRLYRPLDFSVEVAAHAGPDWIAIPGGYRQFLDDGRYLFQTIGIFSSHGGCAVSVNLDHTLDEGLERPPYAPQSR